MKGELPLRASVKQETGFDVIDLSVENLGRWKKGKKRTIDEISAGEGCDLGREGGEGLNPKTFWKDVAVRNDNHVVSVKKKKKKELFLPSKKGAPRISGHRKRPLF